MLEFACAIKGSRWTLEFDYKRFEKLEKVATKTLRDKRIKAKAKAAPKTRAARAKLENSLANNWRNTCLMRCNELGTLRKILRELSQSARYKSTNGKFAANSLTNSCQ